MKEDIQTLNTILLNAFQMGSTKITEHRGTILAILERAITYIDTYYPGSDYLSSNIQTERIIQMFQSFVTSTKLNVGVQLKQLEKIITDKTRALESSVPLVRDRLVALRERIEKAATAREIFFDTAVAIVLLQSRVGEITAENTATARTVNISNLTFFHFDDAITEIKNLLKNMSASDVMGTRAILIRSLTQLREYVATSYSGISDIRITPVALNRVTDWLEAFTGVPIMGAQRGVTQAEIMKEVGTQEGPLETRLDTLREKIRVADDPDDLMYQGLALAAILMSVNSYNTGRTLSGAFAGGRRRSRHRRTQRPRGKKLTTRGRASRRHR